MLQIRAEEISQTQYLLEMKFSAQGLDKKVCVYICSDRLIYTGYDSTSLSIEVHFIRMT